MLTFIAALLHCAAQIVAIESAEWFHCHLTHDGGNKQQLKLKEKWLFFLKTQHHHGPGLGYKKAECGMIEGDTVS